MAYGGSLTVNPETGLPEAGFLKSLLPTLIGAGLTIFSGGAINPLTAGLIVGGVEGARTGDIGKGLMAGLGAYGGAGFGSALSGAGAAAKGAAAGAGTPASTAGASTALGVPASSTQAATLAQQNAAMGLTPTESLSQIAQSAGTVPYQPGAEFAFQQAAPVTASGQLAQAGTGLGNILGTTGTEATQAAARSAGVEALGGSATSAAMKGAAALSGPLLEPAPMPEVAEPEYNYDGPYVPTERKARFPTADRDPADTSEFQYFDVVNPAPGFQTMASAAPSPTDLSGEPTFAGIPVSLATNPDRMREYQANPELYQFAEGGMAKAAPASYQAGVDPEFNYGFQPMANMPSAQGLAGAQAPNQYRSLADLQAAGEIGPGSGFAGTNITAQQHSDNMINAFLKHPQIGPQLRAAGYAEGGMTMDDGGFVIDAHTVSEIGNGSSDAGHMRLADLGGEPIKGPGDGTSDSIKANIGGVQEARIAKDENYLSKDDVKRLGGGNLKKGEKMLYKLMAEAHKSRKNKGRGEATGLDKLISRMA